MIFTIPFPPTVNHIWKASGKRRYLSAEYLRFIDLVGWELKRVRAKSFGDARLGVTMLVNPPDKRRRDIDNVLKAVLDSLARAGLMTDDCQIDQIAVRRGNVIKDGQCIVNVWRFPQDGSVGWMELTAQAGLLTNGAK